MKADPVMQGFYKNTKVDVNRAGMDELNELTITITKTSDGKSEYLQILSCAGIPVNIVLIANKITIEDHR